MTAKTSSHKTIRESSHAKYVHDHIQHVNDYVYKVRCNCGRPQY